jgi:hypothetical protein
MNTENNNISLEIQNPEEEAVGEHPDKEYYQGVEYTGRENLWDLAMWGMTKIHPNLAKTAEFGRLAIAKPAEFIGNATHKVYEALETLLIDKKKDFLGPFATLLGAVVKGMLTGNETESRLDYFRTTIKERKIESKEDVVKYFEDKAKEIPEEEIKHKLMELKNNSKSQTKTENTTPVIENLNGGKVPASNGTIHHQEHFSATNTGKSKTSEQTSHAANLLNNKAKEPQVQGRG